MEIIFEIIFEVIFEGILEGTKSATKWICLFTKTIVLFIIGALVLLMIMVGIKTMHDRLWYSILLWVLTLPMIYAVYKILGGQRKC